MEIGQKVGQKLTSYRTKKGYSVNKLANLAGISQSYLRDIELGNKNPTVEILSILCDTLNITLKEFFDDNSSKSTETDLLLTKIYQLSPKQRTALLQFLDAMNE